MLTAVGWGVAKDADGEYYLPAALQEVGRPLWQQQEAAAARHELCMQHRFCHCPGGHIGVCKGWHRATVLRAAMQPLLLRTHSGARGRLIDAGFSAPCPAEQATVEMIPLKQCAAYLAKEAPNESWDSQFCAGEALAGVLAGPNAASRCGAGTPPLVYTRTVLPCCGPADHSPAIAICYPA